MTPTENPADALATGLLTVFDGAIAEARRFHDEQPEGPIRTALRVAVEPVEMLRDWVERDVAIIRVVERSAVANELLPLLREVIAAVPANIADGPILKALARMTEMLSIEAHRGNEVLLGVMREVMAELEEPSDNAVDLDA